MARKRDAGRKESRRGVVRKSEAGRHGGWGGSIAMQSLQITPGAGACLLHLFCVGLVVSE